MDMRLASNTIAILGAAGFAGVMTFIGLMLGAYWRSLPPAEFLDWFAANSHLIARVIPLFALPTVVGLAWSLRADWNDPTGRALWAAALFAVLAVAVGAIVLFSGGAPQPFIYFQF